MPENKSTDYVSYRPIAGFSGYSVGDNGTVQSCRTRGGRIVPWRDMSPQVDGSDRLFVGLRIGKKIHRSPIHRLVLEAFNGPWPDGCEICHNNGDHRDNRLCNLRWGTHTENCADREAHNRTAKGSRNGSSRLTEDQVREIRHRYASGLEDQYKLATAFNVGQSTINRIVRFEQWRHV